MGGMDDLNFEELVDGALGSGDAKQLSDEDETAKFEMKKLFKPKDRNSLRTPVLSGKKMASDTHGGFPAMDDETAENLLDTKRMKASELAGSSDSDATDFKKIYRRQGLPTEDDEFTVFRLEALFDDDELAELDDSARLAAVRAILKSHDVKLDAIFDDAVARRDALDTYDRRFKSKISRAEDAIREENAKLEKEIEEFAEPRVVKIESNNERLEAMRRTYRDWFERKQGEQARITEIIEPWGGDDRLRVTERVDSVPDAETQPTAAVSTDEVFDGPSQLEESSAAEHVTGPWKMGDGSEAAEQGREPSSVETELPNERVVAPEKPDASVTGEFALQPRLRLPVTPLQGLVAAIAILAWLMVGMLAPAQLVKMEAPFAIGLSFGVPVLVALIVSSLTRAGNRWSTGFFAVLVYTSFAALLVVHLVRPAVFVRSLTERPIWFIDEAGLGEEVEQTFYRAWGPYAEFVGDQLGVESTESADAEETSR